MTIGETVIPAHGQADVSAELTDHWLFAHLVKSGRLVVVGEHAEDVKNAVESVKRKPGRPRKPKQAEA